MNQIQTLFLFLWAGFGLAAAAAGLFTVVAKKQAFAETKWLFPWGIFVWGDAPIIGSFWFGAGLVSALLRDWWLFWLVFSLFWVVRSLGEVIYWLNQQFSSINRNPPQRLMGYKWIGNDSVWFMYQIFWQMVMVVALVGSIFCGYRWIQSLA
jgi:hypothetical protein